MIEFIKSQLNEIIRKKKDDEYLMDYHTYFHEYPFCFLGILSFSQEIETDGINNFYCPIYENKNFKPNCKKIISIITSKIILNTYFR